MLVSENSPTFSIITAVYNCEDYLENAICSVLSQNVDDFEYIIVDDGSTDSSGRIADKYASIDDRVKVIHQENQWIYASFNNGIKAACGKYIYILNSDDRLMEHALEKAQAIIMEHGYVDVILTKVLVCEVDKNGESNENPLTDYIELCPEEDVVFRSLEDVRNNWFEWYKCDLVRNQANFYKRELIKEHPFRNDVYGADLLFNISIASEINSAVLMGYPAYIFYVYHDQKHSNTSIGKYYPYEHEMFNEFYINLMELLSKWGKLDDEKREFVSRRRIKWISHEIATMKRDNCRLTIDEKIECAFNAIPDEVVRECASFLNADEELESRILSGVKNLLLREELLPDSKMYFAFELLEGLLCYETDDEDMRKIEHAVNNDLNPARIGERFYHKLRANYYKQL